MARFGAIIRLGWLHLALVVVLGGLCAGLWAQQLRLESTAVEVFLGIKGGLIAFVASSALFFEKNLFDDLDELHDHKYLIPLVHDYATFFSALLPTGVLLLLSFIFDLVLLSEPKSVAWSSLSVASFGTSFLVLSAFFIWFSWEALSRIHGLEEAGRVQANETMVTLEKE